MKINTRNLIFMLKFLARANIFNANYTFFIQVASSYLTPLRAIAKTFVGMMNEFEYDDFFNNVEEEAPTLAVWILYFLYIVINCIIMMNMLVGLAVDDIKGVSIYFL